MYKGTFIGYKKENKDIEEAKEVFKEAKKVYREAREIYSEALKTKP